MTSPVLDFSNSLCLCSILAEPSNSNAEPRLTFSGLRNESFISLMFSGLAQSLSNFLISFGSIVMLTSPVFSCKEYGARIKCLGLPEPGLDQCIYLYLH